MNAVLSCVPFASIIPKITLFITQDVCCLVNAISNQDVSGAAYCLKNVFATVLSISFDLLQDIIGLPIGEIYKLIRLLQELEEIVTCLSILAENLGVDVEQQAHQAFENVSSELGDNDAMLVYVGSPVDLTIIDSQGDTLSKQHKDGIMGGYLFQIGTSTIAMIAEPEDDYKITTRGESEGTYDLQVNISSEGQLTTKEYENMQTTSGEIHTYDVKIESGGKIKIEREEKSTSFFFYIMIIIIIGALCIGIYAIRYKQVIHEKPREPEEYVKWGQVEDDGLIDQEKEEKPQIGGKDERFVAWGEEIESDERAPEKLDDEYVKW